MIFIIKHIFCTSEIYFLKTDTHCVQSHFQSFLIKNIFLCVQLYSKLFFYCSVNLLKLDSVLRLWIRFNFFFSIKIIEQTLYNIIISHILCHMLRICYLPQPSIIKSKFSTFCNVNVKSIELNFLLTSDVCCFRLGRLMLRILNKN